MPPCSSGCGQETCDPESPTASNRQLGLASAARETSRSHACQWPRTHATRLGAHMVWGRSGVAHESVSAYECSRGERFVKPSRKLRWFESNTSTTCENRP